jgi:sirohydrochlorin ferrochelatase
MEKDMVGVLILAHGSREGETENTMRQITQLVKSELQDVFIEEAYMQFRAINIEKGLESLVERGADDIKVIPYFLFEGVHIKEDIPAELKQFMDKHPDIKITLGQSLGADKRLADIVVDRVRQTIA